MTFIVAQTIATREDAVAERIHRLGYETMVPKGRFRIEGRHRVVPIFPGYVIVEIIAQWYEVRWAVGVLRVIMAGDQPARLPEFEVDKIRRETGKNGLVRIPKAPRQPLKTKIMEGAVVRILTGHFRGIHAIYDGMNAQQRAMVLLDLLGRKCPVELADDDRIEEVPQDLSATTS